MRWLRYQDEAGNTHFGVREGENVFRVEGTPFGSWTKTEEPADGHRPLSLLAPIEPAAILCIGLNYRRHAEETNAQLPQHPVLFMKNPGALQHPGQPILLPRFLPSTKVDYEVELAVVIGRATRNVTPEQALDHVLGFTCGNDVSARDWQKHGGGGQWCRGKSFDTFCPLGPELVTPEEIGDPQNLRLRTLVNGEVLQDWNTSDMIFSVAEIIAFLSGSTTLQPGTVILTGTPHGVGMARTPARWLQSGDEVTVEIEKIGALTNPVLEEPI
jgi:2-keto-4-pentenoate hydratase/2-oxohepta-3-ene-1,7-dioic acid hydratase in catechol pathway